MVRQLAQVVAASVPLGPTASFRMLSGCAALALLFLASPAAAEPFLIADRTATAPSFGWSAGVGIDTLADDWYALVLAGSARMTNELELGLQLSLTAGAPGADRLRDVEGHNGPFAALWVVPRYAVMSWTHVVVAADLRAGVSNRFAAIAFRPTAVAELRASALRLSLNGGVAVTTDDYGSLGRR